MTSFVLPAKKLYELNKYSTNLASPPPTRTKRRSLPANNFGKMKMIFFLYGGNSNLYPTFSWFLPPQKSPLARRGDSSPSPAEAPSAPPPQLRRKTETIESTSPSPTHNPFNLRRSILTHPAARPSMPPPPPSPPAPASSSSSSSPPLRRPAPPKMPAGLVV